MKILIIGDNAKVWQDLTGSLVSEGFEVTRSEQLEQGLALNERQGFALILAATDLTEYGLRTPVLALPELTARKLFSYTTLLKRIHDFLDEHRSESFSLADLELNFGKREVRRAGQRIALTPTEFQVLALLAKNSGRVLSRGAIAEQVWKLSRVGATNVVDAHIARLRAKIDGPFPQKLICTIRGNGYLLNDSL